MTHHLTSRGFTLLEALVAVTILTLSVAGPFYAGTLVLHTILASSDRITASYLAQEGLEYVRAMRDQTYFEALAAGEITGINPQGFFLDRFLGGASASYSIQNCFGSGDGSTACYLDSAAPPIQDSHLHMCADPQSCPPLYLQNNLYTTSSAGATTTPFARTLQFYSVTADWVQVVSTVTFTDFGQSYTVSVTDYLYPWQ